MKLNIVMLENYEVTPPLYGGAVRAYNIAMILASRNHNIFLINFGGKAAITIHRQNFVEYKFWSPTPSNLPYLSLFLPSLRNRLIRHILSQIQTDFGIDIIQLGLPWIGLSLLTHEFTNIPFVIDSRDVITLLSEQFAFETFGRAPVIGRTFKRIHKSLYYGYEKKGLESADHVICVSTLDKERIYKLGIRPKTITVIPNGINNENIRYRKDIKEARKELGLPIDSPIILFLGRMDYIPNTKALKDIAEIISRIVSRYIPAARFLIVGRNPPQWIKHHKSFIVTGAVDSPLPYLAASDIAIAPISIGSGTRIKLLDYFAQGKPTISTSFAAEGLPVIHNKHLILEDDMRRFGKRIIELLKDEALRRELSKASMDFVKHYTWENLVPLFEGVYEEVLKARASLCYSKS